MNSRRAVVAVFAILLLVSLAGCASTTLTGSWADPKYTSGEFKKIMVVGVAKREAVRNIFEDAFVTRLREHSSDGIQSRTLGLGDGQIDKETLAAKLTELGCDGVLVTRFIDQKTEQTYYPPSGYAVPSAYYGGYYGYYSGAYAMAYSPGYTVESTTVSLETTLYDVRTGELVWTGLTDTIVSDDVTSQANELINILVREMQAKKLIK
jgi:outer membrane lipoprotein SlyB